MFFTESIKTGSGSEMAIDPLSGIKMVSISITVSISVIVSTLLDFWRWSTSDILSNATRGKFAEFIVGTAVGLNPKNSQDEWDAYDLTTEDGIKIEVKSAAYIQCWSQKSFSKISFSIKPARYWESETNLQRGEPKRHADV
jgi:hypothetical protein